VKDASALADIIRGDPARFEFSPDGVLKAKLGRQSAVGQLGQAKNILQAIGQRVNN
jgi:hypothetical protein